MTTRERLLCMFLPDEDRGIVPQQRAFYNRLNENYHTMFYKPWEEYRKPFKVAGNVYYIGNRLLSIHLIVTDEGLIVYDAGFQHTMPLIVKAINDLGHKPEEVKYVILTHGHFDHYGSAAWLQGLYGAKVCCGVEEKGRFDVPRFGTIPRDDYSLDTVEPDILIHTGDEITLGGYNLKFYETPGHSAGSIASFMDTEEDGKKLRVCFYGDGGPIGLRKPSQDFDDDAIVDALRMKREKTFELLKKEHADVFTAGHPMTLGYNALEKHQKSKENPSVNPFINPGDWEWALAREVEQYDEMLAREAQEEKK